MSKLEQAYRQMVAEGNEAPEEEGQRIALRAFDKVKIGKRRKIQEVMKDNKVAVDTLFESCQFAGFISKAGEVVRSREEQQKLAAGTAQLRGAGEDRKTREAQAQKMIE